MTQFNLPDFTSPQPGSTFLKDNLEPWRDAVHSGHMGNTRPSYVVPGMWWIDDSTTPWVAKIFQGSDDIIMGTLDPVELVFIPSGVEVPIAEDISYDPTESGLDATNVQGAIDELSTDTNNLLAVNEGNYTSWPQVTSGDVLAISRSSRIFGAISGFTNLPPIPSGVSTLIGKFERQQISSVNTILLFTSFNPVDYGSTYINNTTDNGMSWIGWRRMNDLPSGQYSDLSWPAISGDTVTILHDGYLVGRRTSGTSTGMLLSFSGKVSSRVNETSATFVQTFIPVNAGDVVSVSFLGGSGDYLRNVKSNRVV